MTHLDTSFLVDLLREMPEGSGRAHDLLERLADEPLGIAVHVACELYAGAELARQPDEERAKVDALVGALHVVVPGEGFARRYGALLALLRRRGESIATMDLLIATAALEQDAALVTRNGRDFGRVPGLMVMTY